MKSLFIGHIPVLSTNYSPTEVSVEMKIAKVLVPVALLGSWASFAQTSEVKSESKSQFYLDYFDYEDYVYSRGQKTQLGDKVELEMAAKYVYNKDTSARFRFQTRPEDNRENNKTDKFELSLAHSYETLNINLDLELLTNDGSNGGNTLGLDLDSDYTYLEWEPNQTFAFKFYPFNFDGEVGEEFNTWDITRIYYIEGSPTTVASTQAGSEKIAQKTIPGLELTLKPTSNTELYIGAGVATYIYPTNSNFDLVNNPTAARWERKEDFGYKLGGSIGMDDLYAKVEYVTHTEAKETGALLESGASIYALGRIASNFILETELTWTKAGSNPWDTSRSSSWFAQTTPFQPVYADYYSNKQDWIGKSDFAVALKAGFEMVDLTPYALYRYQGKNFVFNEEESAHVLRTADDTKSHGGLHRVGLGSYVRYGNFVVNPEFEYRRSENPVFGNSTDVRSDRILSSFKKNDYVVQLFLSYDFDGNNVFRP